MRGHPPKVAEVECPACGGTGFARVDQPAQPDRKIYPPRRKRCSGKGRVPSIDFTRYRINAGSRPVADID
jgi:hypothetical protein